MRNAILTGIEFLIVATVIVAVMGAASVATPEALAGCCGGFFRGWTSSPGETLQAPGGARPGCCGLQANPAAALKAVPKAGGYLPGCCAPQGNDTAARDLAPGEDRALSSCCGPGRGPEASLPAARAVYRPQSVIPIAGAAPAAGCCLPGGGAQASGSTGEPSWVSRVLTGQGPQVMPASAGAAPIGPQPRP